jgi:hypothetical protein
LFRRNNVFSSRKASAPPGKYLVLQEHVWFYRNTFGLPGTGLVSENRFCLRENGLCSRKTFLFSRKNAFIPFRQAGYFKKLSSRWISVSSSD